MHMLSTEPPPKKTLVWAILLGMKLSTQLPFSSSLQNFSELQVYTWVLLKTNKTSTDMMKKRLPNFIQIAHPAFYCQILLWSDRRTINWCFGQKESLLDRTCPLWKFLCFNAKVTLTRYWDTSRKNTASLSLLVQANKCFCLIKYFLSIGRKKAK